MLKNHRKLSHQLSLGIMLLAAPHLPAVFGCALCAVALLDSRGGDKDIEQHTEHGPASYQELYEHH